MNSHNIFLNYVQKSVLALVTFLILSQCAEEDALLTPQETISNTTLKAANTTTTSVIVSPSDCAECTYIVPSNTTIVDGQKLGLKPGNVICLKASNTYSCIVFRNIVGTSSAPITITNCGGTATLNATGKPYGLKTENSKYFKFRGGWGTSRGIKVNGGHMSLTLDKLSTNFEVHNLELYNSGFAGIMAKTDPSCDDATIRGNFVMRDVSLHDNYVHDTAGEAFYVGNSFYEKGMNTSCGVRLPHTIEGLRIYNNKITNAGWEAIQVGCAIKGASVYNNTIENFGTKNATYQNNGIQFSEGSKGICYGNLIKSGPGIGINIVGYGDCFVHNNVIVNVGSFGIFCDERTTRNLPGFRIINNTIVNPKQDGIRMYNEYVPGIIYNNIIVNPGSYSSYTYPRTGEDAYVYKLNKSIPVQLANNIFTRDINYVKFVSASSTNYKLQSTSPALNKGKDIQSYNIPLDYYKQSRLKGSAFDIGASEY